MAKLRKSKIASRLIIVEGFWQMGKSLVMNSLHDELGYSIIKEPNHLFHRFMKNPHSWYLKQHIARNEKVANMMIHNKSVVMERSLISNAAFDYAKTGKLSKKYKTLLQSIPLLNHSVIFFLYSSYSFIKKASENIKDNYVRQLLIKDNKFYERYLHFYKDIVGDIINNKIFFVEVANGDKYVDKKKFTKIFNQSLLEVERRAKIEECVSAVIKYDNKFLLLYDKNWRHYVLPQGHIEEHEDEIGALKREIKEETGYIDFKVLGKLNKYDYSYTRGGFVVVKKIQPYFIELNNLSRTKRRLEKHENYENVFYDFRKAYNFLRWDIDKYLLKEVKKKKSPQ